MRRVISRQFPIGTEFAIPYLVNKADKIDEVLYWIGVVCAILGISAAGCAIVWGLVTHG